MDQMEASWVPVKVLDQVDLIWEGTTFTNGDTFNTLDPSTLGVTMGFASGSDCDDNDAGTVMTLVDGYTYCTLLTAMIQILH